MGQKQPFRGVLSKRCSENMQQICRRTPIPKCDLNKVALQLLDHETTLEISEFVLNSIEKVKPGFYFPQCVYFLNRTGDQNFVPFDSWKYTLRKIKNQVLLF